MPETSLHLSKPTLAYAKLVATPTETSWSQVYNAGNLFACVSITVEGESDESASLASTGKKLLDNLQAEFFVLEEKSLLSITEVIQKCLHEVPDYLSVAMTVGFFKESILYIFVVGQGRVMMKRQGKVGILLENKTPQHDILTASGYLHNEDTLILETKPFAEDINDETLVTALELSIPNDIAEALSPQLHAKEDGGQAAIIVVYHGASKGVVVDTSMEEEEETIGEPSHLAAEENTLNTEDQQVDHAFEEQQERDDFEEEEKMEETSEKSRQKTRFTFPKITALGFFHGIGSKISIPGGFKLSHTRKLFLSIIVILVVILAISIFFTKKKETDAQQQALFKQVYEPALNKYEGAKALETLNKDVSYEDYLEAKKILTTSSNKFPENSEESKKIKELLAKIEAELSESSPVQSANATEATVGANSLLSIAKANKDAKALTQDDTAVYYVTDKAIVSVSKGSGSKTEIIKNDAVWEDAVGIATYLGNFYVLDRKKGIIKFAAGGYAQSSYFKDKPDVTSAKDLAIDSSVWVLLQDGTILKYTSGVSDGYKAPKLEKAMSDPARIFTDANTSNIYILDRGNSRVIRIAKEGSGHSEYTSSVIKTARDFEVKEKDKKILILSNDKIFEINL